MSRYLPESFFGEKELGGRGDEEILTPPTQKREESGRGEVSYGGHPSGGKSPMFVAKLRMEIDEYERISRTGCFLSWFCRQTHWVIFEPETETATHAACNATTYS